METLAGTSVFRHDDSHRYPRTLPSSSTSRTSSRRSLWPHAIAGLVNVQTLHTTTAIVVNEHEPLLLTDIAALLERAAPRAGGSTGTTTSPFAR